MLPSLLGKSTAKTAASNALSSSVTAPFRVRRCCYSAPLLEQVLRSSTMAIAAATRAITFRDDHQITNNSRRRCYHTSIIRGGSPTRISTAALLLRAANESARLFLSQSPFSTSASASAPVDSGQSRQQFFKTNDKIESYFSAIGGHSDAPPPNLTSNQVSASVFVNSLYFNSMKPFRSPEYFGQMSLSSLTMSLPEKMKFS